jgi:uncharacterized membrane protein YhfC
MKKLLQACVRDYAWIHTSIGLAGNLCFVIGSVLFMQEKQDLGIRFFIIGSAGMLIGSLGNAIVMYVERQWRKAEDGGNGSVRR